MGPQCERPACAEPATVAYGFDPTRCVAWLAPLQAAGPSHGRLCRRHADAMVVPRGWWLDDRRAAEQLFELPTTSPKRVRARRSIHQPSRQPVAFDLESGDAEQDLTTPLPWTPVFVADDDLDGVLNATSPLLSRAFDRVKGSGTRARPPA